MSKNVNVLLVAAALGACVAASSASGGTVVTALAGGPFASGDITALPSSGLGKGNTYDFTFSWSGDPATTSISTDASGPTPISQFQLYSGTPGSGAFAAQTSVGLGTSLTFSVARGDYYVEVQPGQFKAAAVPEPAAWAMMLLGLGGLGVAVRAGRGTTRAAT